MQNDRIKEAQDTIRLLGDEKTLGRRKQKQLDEAQEVLADRRRFIRNLLIGSTAVGFGGVEFLLRLTKKESTETPQSTEPKSKPAPRIDQEKATDLLIQRVEKGFEHFHATMMPKIETVSEPILRDELKGPFDVIKINQKFPHRNGPRFDREELAKGIMQTALSNPYYFTYAATDPQPGLAASFMPPSRRMELSTDFEENNTIDMLILYHELRHVVMDSNIRMSFPPNMVEKYMANFSNMLQPGEKKHVNVLEEIFAYGLEIEMLDLCLDGELKGSFLEGRPITPEYILQRLKGRTDQLGVIKILLEFASAYYPQGMKVDPIGRRLISNKRFMDAVSQTIEKLGFDPFTFDQSEGFKEYKR